MVFSEWGFTFLDLDMKDAGPLSSVGSVVFIDFFVFCFATNIIIFSLRFFLCLFIYNHTFPEYLISTLPHPRRIHRHTYRPRKRKLPPNNPSYYHR